MRFSVGVNYWPRGSGLAMWRRFDRGEIAEDFARIAQLGLDTVRLFLTWPDFQPQPETIDTAMLERLVTVATLASERGLRVMPVLCTGYADGALHLPAWANAQLATYYSGALCEAQVAFARAASAALADHPALYAWDIGHAFTNVREPARGKLRTGGHETEPAAEREVAAWSRALVQALRSASDRPCTAGTFSEDLTEDRNLRLGSLCAPFAFASMQGSSAHVAFARHRLDPEVVPFLAMVAAGFSFKPVLVTGVGMPDDPIIPELQHLSEEESAAYCTAVLERLHADGRLGAYWWCWCDDAQGERRYGLLRSDGTEKPVASAIAAFARRALDVVPADDMPIISSAYYYRTLPTSTQTLYDSFLASVRERREAASSG